ncbi:hypothetical protein ACFSUM_17020 [Virgibacillus siamensis]
MGEINGRKETILGMGSSLFAVTEFKLHIRAFHYKMEETFN